MRCRCLCVLIISLLSSDIVRGQQPSVEQRVKVTIEDYRMGNTDLLFALKDSPDRIKTLPYLKSYVTATRNNCSAPSTYSG